MLLLKLPKRTHAIGNVDEWGTFQSPPRSLRSDYIGREITFTENTEGTVKSQRGSGLKRAPVPSPHQELRRAHRTRAQRTLASPETHQEACGACALVDSCYEGAQHDPVGGRGHISVHWRRGRTEKQTRDTRHRLILHPAHAPRSQGAACGWEELCKSALIQFKRSDSIQWILYQFTHSKLNIECQQTTFPWQKSQLHRHKKDCSLNICA